MPRDPERGYDASMSIHSRTSRYRHGGPARPQAAARTPTLLPVAPRRFSPDAKQVVGGTCAVTIGLAFARPPIGKSTREVDCRSEAPASIRGRESASLVWLGCIAGPAHGTLGLCLQQCGQETRTWIEAELGGQPVPWRVALG